MRRLKSALIALLFFFGFLLAPAVAAVKVGSSCSKVGQTSIASGKKFTCIKSGTKLIWNKGVPLIPSPNEAVPAKSPTSQSSANASNQSMPLPAKTTSSSNSINKPVDATRLGILGSEIAARAREQFLEQLNSALNQVPNLEFQISVKTDSKLINQIKKDSILSANFWSQLRPTSKKVIIYIAPTEDFHFFIDVMAPTLTSDGLEGGWLDSKERQSKIDPNFFGGGAPAFDKNGNAVFMMYAPNSQDFGNGFWTQTTSHEYVHIVQRYLTSGNMSPMYEWVKEGQADYIGANFATRNNDKSFASYWIQLIQVMDQQASIKGILDWNADQFVIWFKQKEFTLDPTAKGAGDVPLENYVIGAMAMQYLYGQYGYLNVNQFFKNLNGVVPDCGNGDVTVNLKCSAARNSAFVNAFGINFSDFYPLVSKYIVSEIQWAKVNNDKYPKNLLQIASAPWL